MPRISRTRASAARGPARPAGRHRLCTSLVLLLCAAGLGCDRTLADTAAPVPQPAAAATTPAELAADPPSAPPPTTDARPAASGPEALPAELRPEEEALLLAWYERLGPRKAEETFTALVGRAAVPHIGKPYFISPEADDLQAPQLLLSSFQCASLVRSTLAVARCIWVGQRTAACFRAEMEAFRHRGGQLDGHASKLHYFEDWLADNAGRGRLSMLTADLGGEPHQRVFSYLTDHPAKYPQLELQGVLPQILAVQKRLSAIAHLLVPRRGLAAAQAKLRTGDVVGIATRKRGLLITHTGLILRGNDGVPRLLHASSHHKRVVMTKGDLKGYMLRRPERVGVMVARPLPPSVGGSPGSE